MTPLYSPQHGEVNALLLHETLICEKQVDQSVFKQTSAVLNRWVLFPQLRLIIQLSGHHSDVFKVEM